MKSKILQKRGFTLIELLVVIAVIGILATVTVSSLSTGKNKGEDSAIKHDLVNIRDTAELLFSTNGTYGSAFSVAACANTAGTLFGDSVVWQQISHALAQSGGLTSCASTAATWAVAIELKLDTTKAWCVDSSGASKQVALATSNQAGINAKVAGGVCSAS